MGWGINPFSLGQLFLVKGFRWSVANKLSDTHLEKTDLLFANRDQHVFMYVSDILMF